MYNVLYRPKRSINIHCVSKDPGRQKIAYLRSIEASTERRSELRKARSTQSEHYEDQEVIIYFSKVRKIIKATAIYEITTKNPKIPEKFEFSDLYCLTGFVEIAQHNSRATKFPHALLAFLKDILGLSMRRRKRNDANGTRRHLPSDESGSINIYRYRSTRSLTPSPIILKAMKAPDAADVGGT
ncbi:hypothetical protein NQ318_006458 [Aromia moschata]|uniref:Uncharacterized protein n=1 Tax=Aromia moschata TaxID=1265417 RepID=A0AAV8XRR8_9CUCU|nr:hypothetical protein NQ318_006458 [Aromia moschata]